MMLTLPLPPALMRLCCLNPSPRAEFYNYAKKQNPYFIPPVLLTCRKQNEHELRDTLGLRVKNAAPSKKTTTKNPTS